MSLRITRRRAAALSALAALAVAGSAAASFAPLPGPLGRVNDDPAAGIDPAKSVNAADVVGGSLTAGGRHVPWAVFEQVNEGPIQVFSRSFANGVWTTRGAALNLDAGKDAEAPSIDFAGPGRTVPWAAWYEDSAAFPGATQIFASRFDAAGDRWLPAGQDRTAGGRVPSLNIHTDSAAENPAVFGGATTAGADPVPWVAWQEEDGPATGRRQQIFVSRGVKAGAGQAACTGFSPGDGPVVNGFCWQETGIARVSPASLKSDNATDPSLNVDTSRDGIEPDAAFTGPGDTVPWVVWYETGPSGRGLAANEMVFAAKAVKDDAAEGGFRWVAVGRAGTGVLDASDAGGPCATGAVAEGACSLNADPSHNARDPRVAAGTMTPGTPTVPWVVWTEGISHQNLFAARLVGDRFELLNNGQPLSIPTTVNAETPDITFSGNTPHVTWREGARTRSGHFEGPAANPVFVLDDPEITVGAGFGPRISSGCAATPATSDGAACPGGALGSVFVLSASGPNPQHAALVAHGHVPDAARTIRASSVDATSATLEGQASTGGGPARVRFEYGPTTAYGSSTTPSVIPASRSAVAFSARAAGLPAGTPIHFRAVVESDFGSVAGPDAVFTTAPAPPVTANRAPRVRLDGLRPVVGRRGNVSLRLRLSVDEAAAVTVQARRRGRLIATRFVARTSSGAFRVRIGVGRRSGRVNLRITARDPQGAARTVTRGILIVR